LPEWYLEYIFALGNWTMEDFLSQTPTGQGFLSSASDYSEIEEPTLYNYNTQLPSMNYTNNSASSPESTNSFHEKIHSTSKYFIMKSHSSENVKVNS
jgi:hypothetical protein